MCEVKQSRSCLIFAYLYPLSLSSGLFFQRLAEVNDQRWQVSEKSDEELKHQLHCACKSVKEKHLFRRLAMLLTMMHSAPEAASLLC